MIRRGKQQGWLKLPPASINAWAALNGVRLEGVRVDQTDSNGLGLVAVDNLSKTLPGDETLLMQVPRDLILSKANVELWSLSDKHVRDILDAASHLAETTRGTVLLFLLVCVTHHCPDTLERVGLSGAVSDYVKYLPLENLPTFWSDDELDLIRGTSLWPATQAKLSSLQREFDHLRDATNSIPWCQKCWWSAGQAQLDDWKQLDAIYRSRALEFPGIGDAMVPCLDMANHASNERTSARYEADSERNGQLLLLEGVKAGAGKEVTITYGDAKGACEMLFSYGFLEEGMEDARDIFLDLQIPDDDPLKRAKQLVARCAPGVRLYSKEDGIQWASQYVWLICINEEDGLEFKVAQTREGEQELVVSWKAQGLSDLSGLGKILEREPMWDLYHLRAIVTIQERVRGQIEALVANDQERDCEGGAPRVCWLSQELRRLELALLERALDQLETQKVQLSGSEVVARWLTSVPQDEAEDDFS